MHPNMIIYISKATRTLSPAEVEQIAAASAKRNKEANITGLLLQVGNYFVQVLEGEAYTLDRTLKRIEADQRHTGIRIIYQASSSAKMFSQWNMGYFNIEQHYQANRLDFMQLQRYAEETFATRDSSKEAIVQVIRTMPALMQSWQTVNS